jgi:hypothetical protein
MSNSSGDTTTDETPQEALKVFASHEEGESKMTLEQRLSSASPDPEMSAMSVLATNTVQALGTLMEVVTPTTSNGSLESKVTTSMRHDSNGYSSPDQSFTHGCITEDKNEGLPTLSSEKPVTTIPDVDKNYCLKMAGRRGLTLRQTHSLPVQPELHKVMHTTQESRFCSKATENWPKLPVSELPMSSELNQVNGEEHDKAISEEDRDEFFGYCHRCGKAVVGEDTGCLALGKVFHTDCLNCFICKKDLSGKSFYTVDQNILCEMHYLKTLQKCCFCNQKIKDKVLMAFDEAYHPHCFRCAVCGTCLDGVPYAGQRDNIYCIKDYHKLFAPPCASCGDGIIPHSGKAKNMRVLAKDKYYHVRCYKCEVSVFSLAQAASACNF